MHTSRVVAHQEGAAVVDIGRDSLNPGPIAIDATHATEIGMATPFLQARRGSADQEIVIDRLERGQEINKQLGAVAGAPKRQAQRCRALGEVRKKTLAADPAMAYTGSCIDRSNATASARPSWIPTSTGSFARTA